MPKSPPSNPNAHKGMPAFLPPNAAGIPSELTLRRLFDMSVGSNGEKLAGVHFTSLRTITLDGCHGIKSKTITNFKGHPSTYYDQWIWAPDRNWGMVKGKFVGKFWGRPSPYVAVSCTCLDFVYRWEYALTQKGASRIWFCNGEPPVEKNPSELPVACKHLIVVMSAMARQKM